jgi:1,4-dihydroxy-2-naphthoate octaprenyltransferase
MVTTEIKPNKVILHLWTLPRWFAAPFFGLTVVLGALLAGGLTLNSWIGVIAGLLIMAGGHAFNSFLDYAWTGLDKGDQEDRSAEKNYTGAQNLLAAGILSLKEVLFNALLWYILALVPLIYLAVKVGWPVLLVGVLGMLVTFWYSKAKFNWTHELALGTGVGPLAALIGMYATSASPAWWQGILAGIPSAIILSFAGLALDEYPDAEANLKKGVRSLAYKVWENGFSLELYIITWMMFLFIFQIFLIVIDVLKPLTGLSFLMVLPITASMVFLKRNFNKTAFYIVIFAAIYLVLMVLGQVYGR